MGKWKQLRGVLHLLSNDGKYLSRATEVSEGVVSWEQISSLDGRIAANPFPRSESVDRQYREHRDSLNNDQNRIRDYILAQELTVSGKKLDSAIAFNKFPYSVEHGVFHLVFWMAPGKELSMADVRKLVLKKLHGFDVVIFKNAPMDMSVQLVPHYHVFVRRTHHLA